MTYTNQTDLPPLSSHEEALFAAFVANGLNPEELLKNPAFKTSEVLAFLVSPKTQAHLAALNTTTHLALTHQAAKSRRIAMDALERVIKNAPENLSETRRAAFALLRATATPLIPPPKSAAKPSPAPSPPLPPTPDFDPLNYDDPRMIQMLQPQPHHTPEELQDIADLRARIPQVCALLGRRVPAWLTQPPPNPETAAANPVRSP